MFNYLFETIKKTTIYDGFLPVTKYDLKHQLFNGGWSHTIVRECQERRGGVIAVLPYDPQRDQVVNLFVRSLFLYVVFHVIISFVVIVMLVVIRVL